MKKIDKLRELRRINEILEDEDSTNKELLKLKKRVLKIKCDIGIETESFLLRHTVLECIDEMIKGVR